MRLVVGLGNPGKPYEFTRHNVGFWVLDRLVQQKKGSWRSKGAAQLSEVVVQEQDGLEQPVPPRALTTVLMKPLTYMNLSGRAVFDWLAYHSLEHHQICVVYDDVSLPFGRLRLRYRGSAGGHNGLSSIIQSLKTQEIPRLRIGIGRPQEGKTMTDHVLGTLLPSEKEQVPDILDKAIQAIETWVQAPTEDWAMQRINP